MCNRNYLNHEFEAKYSITLFGYSLINISSFQWLPIYKIRILNEESISLVKLVVFTVKLKWHMIAFWKISQKIVKFTAIVSMKFVHFNVSNAMRLLFRKYMNPSQNNDTGLRCNCEHVIYTCSSFKCYTYDCYFV